MARVRFGVFMAPVHAALGWLWLLPVDGQRWADPEATRRSYELFARHVMPRFQNSASRLQASEQWSATVSPCGRGLPGALSYVSR